MKRRMDSTMNLITSGIILTSLVLMAVPAMAQEETRSQVNLQLTGLIPKDSSATDTNGSGITDQATRSVGFLAGYTFKLSRWAAVEGDYGFSRNTETYSGSFGTGESRPTCTK